MKEIRIVIPDTLANEADAAGLLSPEAVEAMLRTTLKAKVKVGIESLFSALGDEISPEQETEIIAQVRKVRAQRKTAG